MSILYYFNGSSWQTSSPGLGFSWSETAKNRFATLGGSEFITNSVNGMRDSTDANTWGTTNSITSVKPSLVYRYGARLLASGDTTYPSRVYFSSIIDPSSSPFITWNTDASIGDWIDINPDDGGQVTGFSETSTFLLVFKGNGMYRLDTVNKSTSPQNIFNIGAVSQEGIVACQGIVYFFSGIDIRQTDGGFPAQISRAGVQDIIDAIPQANWSSVAAGTDGLNVYFSVGDVTLNSGQDNQETITNCELKFSPRDQSWSVHSKGDAYKFFTLYTDSTNGRVMRGADTGGHVQSINIGTTDNGAAIDFSLETQDVEFGNRARLKGISDELIIFSKNGQDSSLVCFCDEEPKNIKVNLTDRVNYAKGVNLEGHYFRFNWYGTSSGTPPMLEGFYAENITDKGLTNS